MKYLILLLALFTITIANAQHKIGSYYMEVAEETFDVSVFKSKATDADYHYLIQVSPVGKYTNKVSLIISSDDIDLFKQILRKSAAVYHKWKETAVLNEVKELDKEIEIPRMKIAATFNHGSKWKYDLNVRPKARFKIVNGQHLLIISNTYELKAADNEYYTSKGFVLVFSSIDDVEDFIANLDTAKAQEAFAKKESKEDLFKQ